MMVAFKGAPLPTPSRPPHRRASPPPRPAARRSASPGLPPPTTSPSPATWSSASGSGCSNSPRSPPRPAPARRSATPARSQRHLHLPSPRQGSRGEPGALLSRRDRHHPARFDTAHRPGEPGSGCLQQHPHRSDLDRRHRQRGPGRVPHRALSGQRVQRLHADRQPARHRSHVQRHHGDRGQQLQLPGAGR
jgi:hypothetical protein